MSPDYSDFYAYDDRPLMSHLPYVPPIERAPHPVMTADTDSLRLQLSVCRQAFRDLEDALTSLRDDAETLRALVHAVAAQTDPDRQVQKPSR